MEEDGDTSILARITKRDLEDLLKRLNIQKKRFIRAVDKLRKNYRGNNIYISHDRDYYFVILRRLYRFVDKLSKKDSRVANIKGDKDYRDLCKKVKIRDHSEHPPEDFAKFPSIKPGSVIKVINGTIVNNNGIFIQSGSETWDIKKDHDKFIEMIGKVMSLLTS